MSELLQLDRLVTPYGVGADALELQLSRSQQLERVVVERAGEAAPGFVAAGRDVVEEVPAGGHRFFEAPGGVAELVFGFLVLPQQSRRRAGESQQP